MKSIHSFAICAYKQSPYLQSCIDSLKTQISHSKIMLCTSTPSKFLENCAKKNNLEYRVNPKKEGIAGDWNFALKQAETKYVTLAHQDDIYFPDFSKQAMRALEQHHDSLIAYTNYNEIVHKNDSSFIRKNSLNFYVKNIINYTSYLGKDSVRKNKTGLLKFGSPIGCPSVTYNLSNLKNFSFSTAFSINMDWFAWHQLSKQKGSFVWINKPLMSHRIHIDSETSQGLAQNRRQLEDKLMFSKFWPPLIATALSRVYAISYRNNQ
jgi:cellulose synthase/poly-beta-1,6-N-acetylglucosamine synthase-like glycosyltransferase